MDPVSLCGSILAIIAGAQSGVQGLRKVKECWNAPRQIDELTAEVENLQSVLRNVYEFIQASKSSLYSEDLFQPVQRADSIVNSITFLMSSRPFRPANLSNAHHARLVWIRHKSQILALFETLKLVRADLSVRLALFTASTGSRVEQSLSISIGIQGEISQQLSVIIDRGLSFDHGSPRRYIEPVSSEGIYDDADLQDTEQGNGSLARQPSNNSQGPSHAGYPHLVSEAPRNPNKQQLETCNPWCSCECHVKRSFKSPWVLEMVIGRINVQYTGQRPECNEKRCQRSLSGPLSITCQLPRYLLCRYITLTMHYTPLDGPRFTLRAPRVTPWSHVYWDYARNGDLEAIQSMFSQGKASPYDVNLRGSNALVYTSHHDNCRISQFLIEQGADPNLPNETGKIPSELLWDSSFAGLYGDEGLDIVGAILKDTDYRESRQFSILHKIMLGLISSDLRSQLEVSTAYIDMGDAQNRTPLCWAVIRDDTAAVETLLAFAANPNLKDNLGHAPLDFARSAAVCRSLLSAGADVSSRNSHYQRTALHCLCHAYGAVEVVELLVEAGVPVDVRDSDDETPLLNAIFGGLTAAAKRLIELGADVNAANRSSCDSAIHLAISSDHYQIIPLLLANGADIAASSNSGRNIAHKAARSASPETFKVLAESNLRGLDVLQEDHDGKSPADYLAERDFLRDNKDDVYEAFGAFVRSVSGQGRPD